MANDRGHLLTEQANERSIAIDAMSVDDAFEVMSAEDATVAGAVGYAKPQICAAIELVVEAFRAGGRLIYVGAGTSGRLGVLDAAECPPTFLSDPSMVQGVIAGGSEALRRSIEGAEDVALAGSAAIDAKQVGAKDVVFGIATGGTTPYVHAALDRAKSLGAKTIFFACVPVDQVSDDADVSIRVLTGPEVITGSTRLKAGTATKMVLNMISTLSMVGIGKVHGNLMVDLNTRGCDKLRDRAVRVLQAVTDLDRAQATQLLKDTGGHVKTAIVMQLVGVDRDLARALLDRHGGRIADISSDE
jgi:N-acetylmuramic acid 6-phosphate etherase